MKRILSIVTLAAVTAASCTTQPSNSIGSEGLSSNAAPVMDTAGYAEFKAFQQWKSKEATTASYAAAAAPAERKSNTVYRKSQTRQVSSQAPASSESTEASEPVEQEKKGWSKAAKGAVIGAGSGAVIGAVVHKRNRAVGAAIGGVVGGGVGYGIGRHMDKKDGRY